MTNDANFPRIVPARAKGSGVFRGIVHLLRKDDNGCPIIDAALCGAVATDGWVLRPRVSHNGCKPCLLVFSPALGERR